jgi:hypothetical protein
MYDDFKILIFVNQHGFMKNRSTMTNLLEYASFVLNSIEEGWQLDCVYTDFSKAFDRVRHQLLLAEMSVVIEPTRSYKTIAININIFYRKNLKLFSRIPG